ncbi:long-chain fatty acid--CoA ligase [Mesorhizobium sp. SARCC-RB16n]|uniref:long-chain-fatty-acid--CoA ligase n=1 Tax=Mesorhizobium sp. SARCC-RB16n TaxID=2116687 RepID=UPI00122F7615|nr:long-chain-fatty-acid--CoA ligase [Mesorhizobium sp. SARCC-RB16n]KAA3450243.1 long-chain fatty acid--CoA ligase [Mesorhizobium sp. SARCC-RB16n]
MAKASKAPMKAPAKAISKPAAGTDGQDKAAGKAAAAKAAAKPAKNTPTAKAAASAGTGKKPATKAAPPKASASKGPSKAATTKSSPPPAKTAPVSKPAAATSHRLPKALTELTAGLPQKPWLNSYPKNMPAEIGALPYGSIGDFLVGACKQFAGQPAFTCMGKSITYAELEQLSAAFGAYLQSTGLQKGARVALMMPNVLQYPVAMMAVARGGFTVVNVNPLYTPRELEHQLKDSGAQAIVILENFANTLQAVVARTSVKHVIVAAMGDMLGGLKGSIVNLVVRRVKKMVPAWSLPGHVKFNAALKAGRGMAFKPATVAASDVAFLQYTGGTTGISKGATLLHSNVLANVAQNSLWLQDAYTVKPKPAHLNLVCALPLYHIFALTVNALMGMQMGGQNILIPNPRDIPGFVKEMGKYPIHIFPGLNTLFNALLNNEDFRKLDFKPLLLTLGGGMAVQKGVAERWKALTGCPVSEGYGLSETSPVATANKFSSGEFTGTIGLPLPSTEIAIRDDDGNNVPLGEVGEICIRGPQVMAGYWNRTDETAKVMTEDGFFKSGDMGFMDERGYTKIVDRKKDMILVSGFNVYPNELEEVVAAHPGVLEVAAIGVPDEHSGEVPKLFIVKKDPALTAEAITAFCRENLTGYKRPRYIEFRTELPKTPVGKILRRALRE